MHYAHSYVTPSGRTYHGLLDHLQGVADKIAGGNYFKLLGLFHDAGKFRTGFQEYLLSDHPASFSKEAKTHSAAGAIHLAKLLHKNGYQFDSYETKIASIAIMCHHTGLQDGFSIKDKMQARKTEYQESVSYLHQIPAEQYPIKGFKMSGNVAMRMRFTLSKLVHADWTDTANFYKTQPEISYDSIPVLDSVMEKHMSKFVPTEQIHFTRNEILEDCIASAEKTPGWFSLSVPTGGGKTLSGMRFALKHARTHEKKRVIVVIPYTSIIDQTAKIYKSIFGKENVLEHHSNFDPKESNDEGIDKYKLQAQTWDSPIIVTTVVQFLESLFACKNSKLRKLQAIENSVIILDESQLLPVNLLTPTMDALKSLVEDFNCSIVLSTATQADYAYKYNVRPQEIISNPGELHGRLKRVEIEYEPNFNVHSEIIQHGSSLTIVNTRKHALDLFQDLRDVCPELVYLSAYMHPKHRKQVIAEIKEKLANGEIVKVISTQLVEAGVDFDFPIVFKEFAGLDSIVQAAGRCNREGKQKMGYVIVFPHIDNKLPPSIRAASISTITVLNKHKLTDVNATRLFFNHYLNSVDVGDKLMAKLGDNVELIQFASFAKDARVIDDEMLFTVVCEPASSIKKMQQVSISVYAKDRKYLLDSGLAVEHLKFEDTLVLREGMYDPVLGVIVDTGNAYNPGLIV
jgi:CRISPR-associated endonuclease/helicase Cas3